MGSVLVRKELRADDLNADGDNDGEGDVADGELGHRVDVLDFVDH